MKNTKQNIHANSKLHQFNHTPNKCTQKYMIINIIR